MDPFTIAIGVLGITEFAISSLKQLHDFINNVAEAKKELEDIALTIDAILCPLAALDELDRATCDAAKEDLNKTGVAEAVNKCGQACSDFEKKLTQWTKHSSSTKLSLRDRLSIGIWNKEKIRTLRTRVQSCQAIVQFAVQSTRLLLQLRADDTSKANREELQRHLQSIENAIQEHIHVAKKQQDEADKRLEELQKAPENEENDGAQRLLAIQEVKDRSLLLESDQIFSKAVSSQLQSALSRQRSGDTIAVNIQGDNIRGITQSYNTGPVQYTQHGKDG